MNRTRAENIDLLNQTLSTLQKLTASLTDRALDFRPTTGEWSTREILAHLVDDEMYVCRLRLERIIKENRPDLTPHDEKEWYRTRNTRRDQLAQLLGDFALQRAASLNIIQLLRDSDWLRDGYQPEYGFFTAEEWLGHWTDHDLNHLQQIEKNLEAYRQ